MMAQCLQEGTSRIAVQSSGNTATSVLKYAARTGIQVVLFFLNTNEFKLDPARVPENVFLIEVKGTEKNLKENLARFSQAANIPVRPRLEQ